MQVVPQPPALHIAIVWCIKFFMHQTLRNREEEKKCSSYQLPGAEIDAGAARAVFLAWLGIVLVAELLAVG